MTNVKGTYGSFGEIQGNPGQTTISDIRLENIDVKLKDENLKAVDVRDLKLKKVKVNGKPFTLRPGTRTS